MKRIVGWLKSILTRQPVSDADDQADDLPDDYSVDVPTHAEVVAWMGDNESAEEEYTMTVPQLESFDLDLSDTDESTGIDPYDTAQLHKK